MPLLLWSAELQPLRRMQGAMLLGSSLALEHRHGRSAATQLIALAADSRHGRAHVGSWLTMLSTSVAVLVGVFAVFGEVLALWPSTGAIKMAAEARRVAERMLNVVWCGNGLIRRLWKACDSTR